MWLLLTAYCLLLPQYPPIRQSESTPITDREAGPIFPRVVTKDKELAGLQDPFFLPRCPYIL
nr:unnamed protein product [Callosobruchus chinensis]